jgi:hypothetical protein
VAGIAIAKLLSLFLEPWLLDLGFLDQDIFIAAKGLGSDHCRCGLTSVFYTAWSNLGIERELHEMGKSGVARKSIVYR